MSTYYSVELNQYMPVEQNPRNTAVPKANSLKITLRKKISFPWFLPRIRKFKTRSSVNIKFVTSSFRSSNTAGAIGDDD